jgi:hypothetical protein
MDRGEGVVTTTPTIVSTVSTHAQAVSYGEITGVPEQIIVPEMDFSLDQPIEQARAEQSDPSGAILQSLEHDDVEKTFQRLADGDFRSPQDIDDAPEAQVPLNAEVLGEPEPTVETIGSEKNEVKDIPAEVLEDPANILDGPNIEVPDNIPVDNILHQELLVAIKEGRIEEAHTLMDAMLIKEGHEVFSEGRAIQEEVQKEKVENLEENNLEMKEDLAYTKEQLAQSLKIMQDLAETLKLMVEKEGKDSQKVESLLDLLGKIAAFILTALVAETPPVSHTNNNPKGPGFKSMLFSKPQIVGQPQEKLAA